MRVLLLLTIGTFLLTSESATAQMKNPKWWWSKEKKEIFRAEEAEREQERQRLKALEDAFVYQTEASVCEEEALLESLAEGINNEDNLAHGNCHTQFDLGNGKLIDQDYLDATAHYYIWDQYNVDPYHIPIKEFKDTVALQLFDEALAEEAWAYPIDPSRTTSKYGFRRWRFHHGIDLKLNIGDSVRATFDGVVRIAKYDRGGYGYYVMIRHKNGLETLYGHLTEYLVRPGDEVKAGQLIGLGGNTGRSSGPHLHFEVRYQGHGFDPAKLFDFDGHTPLAANMELAPEDYALLKKMSESVYHRIRRGDSLWTISRRYRTSINKICRLNGISRRTTLRVGRKLRVR
ncbi:M23 family metallopeptidase [Algivirga pacifica]|uniref:LysM domain-containing protein n=1 Tax=Algivirga pacifica TaxID=1162670 RepID=A0ABP9DAW6_9BACT